MQLNYYILLSIALLIAIVFVRFLFMSKKNEPVRLFSEALRNENKGDFEEAVLNYQNALEEVRKIRFHGQFENKILEKIKLLNTVIEYEQNARFSR